MLSGKPGIKILSPKLSVKKTGLGENVPFDLSFHIFRLIRKN